MRKVQIGRLAFGEGIPKICVPLVGEGIPAIITEMKAAFVLPADLLEWRMDYFFDDPKAVLPHICKEKGNYPLIATLRTAHDGGKAELSYEAYGELLSEILDIGCMEVIDIELSAGEGVIRPLVKKAKDRQVAVILSKHDFKRTPAKTEMVETLQKMAELGADLPKIAVMPQNRRDVLTLLEASLEADALCGPVVAISMGELGKISRVGGSYFGSAMTFAAGAAASAPGQLSAEDIAAILQDLSGSRPLSGRTLWR